MRRASRALSPVLIVVFAAATTMLSAVVIRAGCLQPLLEGSDPEGWCGTQIVDLQRSQDLTDGRLPLIEECRPPVAGEPCEEYPVLTLLWMRLGAIAGADPMRYFLVSAAILTAAAVAAAWWLARSVGTRALYFALAPGLLLYGLMNWDLIGVAFLVWGIGAFLRGRDTQAGMAMGLAVATKVFPGVFLVAMAADRWRSGRPDRAGRLFVSAMAIWLIVNLPFVVVSPTTWSFFFRFQASRPADIDSLWYIACERLGSGGTCSPAGLVDVLSLAAFVAAAGIVWWAKARSDPGFAPWTLGFAFLALFFLTSKVYSPQYDLWLLPWFALVLPSPVLFAAFSATEIAIFLTRYADFTAPPGVAFQVFTLLHDAVLVLCVVAYARSWIRKPEPLSWLPADRSERVVA